jgi:hypothetical protein
MIQLPDDIDVDDVLQWVGRGVSLVRINDEMVPCTLEEVSDSRRALVRPLLDTQGREVEVLFSDIYAAWPDCGAVNVRTTRRGQPVHYAMYVTRQQRRQYTRTANPRCLHAYIPERWAVYKATRQLPPGPGRELTASVIAQMFNQEYPAIPAALGKCEAMVEDWGGTLSSRLPQTLCRPPAIGSSLEAANDSIMS